MRVSPVRKSAWHDRISKAGVFSCATFRLRSVVWSSPPALVGRFRSDRPRHAPFPKNIEYPSPTRSRTRRHEPRPRAAQDTWKKPMVHRAREHYNRPTGTDAPEKIPALSDSRILFSSRILVQARKRAGIRASGHSHLLARSEREGGIAVSAEVSRTRRQFHPIPACGCRGSLPRRHGCRVTAVGRRFIGAGFVPVFQRIIRHLALPTVGTHRPRGISSIGETSALTGTANGKAAPACLERQEAADPISSKPGNAES